MNTLKNIIQCVDEQLREMLGAETNELVDSSSSLFDDWWDSNIEVVEDDNVVESVTDIWYKFRQENKGIIKQFDITMDKFKQFVKTKMPPSCIVTKTKSVNSTFDVKGVKIKKIKVKTVKKTDDVSVPVEFYFNEVTDVTILEEYKENSLNIMSIADRNVVRPWQVVSVLLRHKVISKRDDARGYDVYKQTEEYTSKLKKK